MTKLLLILAAARGATPPDTIILSTGFFRWMNELGQEHFLDKWDWIAMISGFISLLISGLVWISQKRTEKNTSKITKNTQISLLIDYIRHFYANLVIARALNEKMAGKFGLQYPSQEHILKLSIDFEALHPDAFFRDKEKYDIIHNLLLLVRNYNIETEVINRHLSSPGVPVAAKERDFSTLTVKPSILCRRFFMAMVALGGEENRHEYCLRVRKHILDEALKRDMGLPEEIRTIALKPVLDREDAAKIDRVWNDIPHRFYDKDNCFAELFFKDCPSLFFYLINHNIDNELGNNDDGTPKLFMIPFVNNSNGNGGSGPGGDQDCSESAS